MTHDYPTEQVEMLLELMPEVMAALRQIRDTPPVAFSTDPLTHADRTIAKMNEIAGIVFARLDWCCWHMPACEAGQICRGGLPAEPARSSDQPALQNEPPSPTGDT